MYYQIIVFPSVLHSVSAKIYLMMSKKKVFLIHLTKGWGGGSKDIFEFSKKSITLKRLKL